MPLYLNRRQPYFPDPLSPNNYNCDSKVYCHPVQLGDTVWVQGHQTPCGASEIEDPNFSDLTLGPELVVNGNFSAGTDWTSEGAALPADGWSITGGQADHNAAPSNSEALWQTGLGMVVGTTYRVTIDVTRVSGWINVILGDGVDEVSSNPIDETGSYSFDLLFQDAVNDLIQIDPTPTFDGQIDNISVKAITFTNWDTNGGWSLEDGSACHIEGQTGLLEQTVANYIVANDYYVIGVNASSVVQGSVDVYIANVLVGTISSTGFKYFYGTPTLAGVVSFDPSSDFIGCLDFLPQGEDLEPGLYLLKNSHSADLITQDGVTRYDVSPYISYYEDKVTLELNIETLEVPEGCYYLEIFDACQIQGSNLVVDGDFANGNYTEWQRSNQGQQYDITGGQLEFIFAPLEGASLITNGDFATGDFTGWTAGANWAVVGNAAVHTPGSTATLSQTVNITPPPAPPGVLQHWIQLVMSAWTVGTITVTLADKTSVSYGMNDTITFPLRPTVGGAQSFTITPSSNFDGTIDDIALHEATAIWSDFPTIINTVNLDYLAGNYDLEFEIVGVTGSPNIAVGMGIQNMSQSIVYETGIAVHTVSVLNYVPGGQRAQLTAKFRLGNNYYPGRIGVNNVSAVRVEPFEATYTSECLQYKEDWGSRTRMLTAYCDQDAFGFEFQNTGFRLQQRAGVRSIAPFYPKEKQIQRSGNGSARVVYSGVEKYWQLHTEYVTETFHDAMSVMIDCDHFAVGLTQDNAVEYIAEVEDYNPAWLQDGSFHLAPVVVNLRPKEDGQAFNRHT